VLRVVKGGKEATVYLCTGPEGAHIAAKVYRPRMFRNLRNDAAYRVGTQLRDAGGKEMRKSHEMRAVAKRTRFGQQVLHESWLNNEVIALAALTKAGADVPRMHGSGPNAVLMDYIGAPGQPAPPLESADLAPRAAQALFERVLHNIRLMLQTNIVHGDLSGFNILLWQGELRMIDFPQASNPYRNPNASRFFMRDVQRVCDCFARWCDVPDAPDLAAAIWRDVLGAELDGADEIRSGRWNAG
jgi:RIO kinase 1